MRLSRHLVGTHPVDRRKSARLIGVVLVASALVFVNTSWGYPLAFELAPVALILGTVLGLAAMRSARFWRDPDSGELWMDGGRMFLIAWAVLVAVRIVLSIVAAMSATGPHHTQQDGWVAVSGAFLVASMGLWVARGAVMYRKLQTAA